MTEEIIEVPYGDLYLKFTNEAQSIEVMAGYEGNTCLNGTIKRFAYYNRRMSNTELQSITR